MVPNRLLFTGEVFGDDDDSISMMAHTLDFSSDSNESNDLTLR